MFTGLVEAVGTVALTAPGKDAMLLGITASIDPGELGASLAVDGVCLTVTAKDGRIEMTCGHETLERTTLGRLKVGDKVNLERPVRVGDRLGGHIVSGHVDAIGTVASKQVVGEALDIAIAIPRELARYIVEKGSIAVDGISLTVNRVTADAFYISLIPHTQIATTLGEKPVGAGVNLEVDMMAKYVEKLVAAQLGALGKADGGII